MSQFTHDRFAKNRFELLLKPFGTVQIQRAIRSEAKFVDIYFEPAPAAIADCRTIRSRIPMYPRVFSLNNFNVGLAVRLDGTGNFKTCCSQINTV